MESHKTERQFLFVTVPIPGLHLCHRLAGASVQNFMGQGLKDHREHFGTRPFGRGTVPSYRTEQHFYASSSGQKHPLFKPYKTFLSRIKGDHKYFTRSLPNPLHLKQTEGKANTVLSSHPSHRPKQPQHHGKGTRGPW